MHCQDHVPGPSLRHPSQSWQGCKWSIDTICSNSEQLTNWITNHQRSCSGLLPKINEAQLRPPAPQSLPTWPRVLHDAAKLAGSIVWPVTAEMAENSPELANLRAAPSKPALDKRSSTGDVGTIAKPKKPFLKRGVGTRARITATQRKKYIPKGGFVLTVDVEQGAGVGGVQAQGENCPKQQPYTKYNSNLQDPQGVLQQEDSPAAVVVAAQGRTAGTASADEQAGLWQGLQSHGMTQHGEAAVHPASAALVHHPPYQNSWPQSASLLDPDGGAMEMQSRTELLLHSGSQAPPSHFMAGGAPQSAAPTGADPHRAQEVSGYRERKKAKMGAAQRTGAHPQHWESHAPMLMLDVVSWSHCKPLLEQHCIAGLVGYERGLL